MASPTTHITTSGGLMSAAFIENVRELGSRQRGVEPESFALPWSPAPQGRAALEDQIAVAWELLLERWATLEGGFILSDYGDGEAIGVPLWKKEVMLDAFREFDPFRR